MRIIDGFQLFCCVSTDNHTRVVPYFTRRVWPPLVQPVYDYPRRYTAKQLKTIYYSLIEEKLIHKDRLDIKIMKTATDGHHCQSL